MTQIDLETFSLSHLNNYPTHFLFSLNEKTAQKRGEHFYQKLLEKFQLHFELPNLETTKKVFQYAAKIHKIPWKKGLPLNVSLLKRMFDAFGSTLHYAGKGVYSDRSYFTTQTAILNYLLARREETPAIELLGSAPYFLLKKEREHAFFRGFLHEWQLVVDDAYNLLETEQIDSFIMKNFVGNLLCLMPYTYPKIGCEFSIPIYDGISWKKCLYAIEKKILLTPKWYSSPLPAYGLISHEGPPLLVFQGTTFPAGDGFWAAIVSDFCFGLPVGRLPFLLGKRALSDWMKEKMDVKVFGVSLGGAIALNVAMQYQQFISSVNVYNPPGFYPWNRRKIEGMEVNIFSQWNDLVSNMGFFPEGSRVNIYRTILETDENFVKAHNRAYSGAKHVVYIKTNSQHENRRLLRLSLSLLHVLTPLFFLPLYSIHLIFRLFARIGTLFKRKKIAQ